jgi:hypothetical protein
MGVVYVLTCTVLTNITQAKDGNMNSTALEALLDVAIGLIFMWLILSIATMSIQEWIASSLKWRANDLETAIQRLLADKAWAAQLYNHPLIAGLSKKNGRKPSYIPANKFALALFDIVKTAGTQESFIQQRLLVADRELKKAPNQLGPFLVYAVKRFGTNIGNFFNSILYFLGRDKGTPNQKYTALLTLMQNLLHASDPEKSEDLTHSWKEYFQALLSDETNIDGKVVSTSSSQFLEAYPVIRDYFYDLLQVILKKHPILKQRWTEILIYNDEKLVESVKAKLKPGETLREKLHELSEKYAQEFDIKAEKLDSILMCARQTLDEIDFSPLVGYIQVLIGNLPHGLDALKKLNPPLHKSLQELNGDIAGIVNNTQVMDAVDKGFHTVEDYLKGTEGNLANMRVNSETWFNESMDRLGGWYKRKATLLAFIIGLFLAGFLNVDSIVLAEHLWKEPTLRQALVANATKFAQDNQDLPESLGGSSPQDAVTYFDSQFTGLDVPFGWSFTAKRLEAGQSCSLIPIGKNAVWGMYAEVPESELEGNNGENPAGNEPQQEALVPACQHVSDFPNTAATFAMKLLGIIFSAAAAAQGAPFWFDILKKLVNIRGSGANPDEKSK